jgi:hypothetical protein
MHRNHPQAAANELWWEATVEVPAAAAAMSFCVSAGDSWDNNNRADHKVRFDLMRGLMCNRLPT